MRGFLGHLAIMTVLATGPALAEKCTFTTECFESEQCSETNFPVIVESGNLITDAETISVTKGGSDKVAVFVGVTASAFHVLTHNANGVARYSTHIYDGPLMVSYLGECKS